MADKQKEKNPLRQMAYLIEHDLRQPLAVMKNSVYIINTKVTTLGIKDEKILKYVKILDEEIGRANKMILEIAAFGRDAAGPQKPEDAV